MKINIVRQDSLKFNRANRIKRINRIITFGSIGLFILSVLWTSGQFIYYSLRNSQLTNSIAKLNSLYNSRSKDVAEYMAVKSVIDNVDQIQSKRFNYRDFLNGIYQLLPANAKLSGVEFGQLGVVSVIVKLTSLNDYDLMLTNINNGQNDNKFLFSEVAQASLVRDKTGGYTVNLEMKTK